MIPRLSRLSCHLLVLWASILITAVSGPAALADGLYTITDLGTLSGQSSSVATSINNQGQVVGVSYNSSDGSFASSIAGGQAPPRFDQTGNGAQSFLFSNGQMTQINPTGGLAVSINNSAQVVGGPYSSINDSGQYVGGAFSGVYNTNYSQDNQLVSGGTTTLLSMTPYAINNTGEIAGYVAVSAHGGVDLHPAIYQNGQITDLFSKFSNGTYVDSGAVAINKQGDLLITVWQQGATTQSFLYHADTSTATNLTALPGGAGLIGTALNNLGQVVGNGYIYNDGTVQALASLLPISSGWTNLNATGINDSGQIVGQGTFDGQQVAFLMTPDSIETPEPCTLIVWALVGAVAAARRIPSRTPR